MTGNKNVQKQSKHVTNTYKHHRRGGEAYSGLLPTCSSCGFVFLLTLKSFLTVWLLDPTVLGFGMCIPHVEASHFSRQKFCLHISPATGALGSPCAILCCHLHGPCRVLLQKQKALGSEPGARIGSKELPLHRSLFARTCLGEAPSQEVASLHQRIMLSKKTVNVWIPLDLSIRREAIAKACKVLVRGITGHFGVPKIAVIFFSRRCIGLLLLCLNLVASCAHGLHLGGGQGFRLLKVA